MSVLVARPVAIETTQIGVEAIGSPGTAVAATTLLQALGFTLDTEADVAIFGPAGQLYDTVAIMNREWTTGSSAGIPDYREVAYPLCGLFGDPVITTVATGVYDWVWTPKSSGGLDRPRTFSIEQGVAGMSAETSNYLVFTAFNQSFSREGGNDQGGSFFARRQNWSAQMSTNQVRTITPSGTVSGGNWTITVAGQTTTAIAYNAIASAIQTALEALSNVAPGDVSVSGGPLTTGAVLIETRGVFAQQAVTITVDGTGITGGGTIAATTTTPAVAPTGQDVVPVSPGEINLYVDDTSAALGTTQFLGDFACGWSIGDRRNPVWTLNRSLDSYAAVVETKPNPTFTASVNNDDAGRALLNYLRGGLSKFCRIEAQGPLIDSTNHYEYVVDLHGKISGPPGRGDQSGARSLDWSFRTMHNLSLIHI